jgi:hypothetical protein
VFTAREGAACRWVVRGERDWTRQGDERIRIVLFVVTLRACACVCQLGTLYSEQRNSTSISLQNSSHKAAVRNTTRPPKIYQFCSCCSTHNRHILPHRSMLAAQCNSSHICSHSVSMYPIEQKSIGLEFRTSPSGNGMRYICHHNSSFTFPIFVHSWRFSLPFVTFNQLHRIY